MIENSLDNQDQSSPAESSKELTTSKQLLIFGWELFKVVVISLAIIIPIRAFIVKPFYVKGASMEPAFYDGQYLIINEIGYHLGDPQRGDSVVFRYPQDPSRFFIKRVLGLPGERVVISNGDIILHNAQIPAGVTLIESYLDPDSETQGDVDLTLKEDEYFLLGDNRTASLDSRSFGPVNRSFIVGKTFLRGWPLTEFGLVTNNIEYNLNQ